MIQIHSFNGGPFSASSARRPRHFRDSWHVLKDTYQVCLIQQGAGDLYAFSFGFVVFVMYRTEGLVHVVAESVTHGGIMIYCFN